MDESIMVLVTGGAGFIVSDPNDAGYIITLLIMF
jgi:hypothetical protein